MSYRNAEGQRHNAPHTPGHKRKHTKRKPDGGMEEQRYVPPKLANPGNVVQQVYTAEAVADLLARYERGDVIDIPVGGGRLGSPLAHENEAPYPERLAEAIIRSWCPPDGVVLDLFAGSGTTLAVAVCHGRRAVGCDLRQSQVDLTARRMAEVGGG
jgi:hypothetical protein